MLSILLIATKAQIVSEEDLRSNRTGEVHAS
jgi:hypothetical protein